MPDVFKLLRDLHFKAVGIDPKTNAMPTGYFVSFREIGLPIRPDDYRNPYSPVGIKLDKPVPEQPPADPATAKKTASEQQIDTDAQLANVTDQQRSYINTFLLTDRKLRMSSTYQAMRGTGRMSDAWWAIMTGANGIPPTGDIKPELRAAYDEARAMLMDADGNPTPKYQRYLDYEQKHRAAVKAYNREYSAALTDPRKLADFPRVGKPFQDDVNSAFDQWEGFGARSQIRRAIDTLAAQGTDPAIALISRAKRRWENSLLTFPGIGSIPWTIMSPSSWYEPDDDTGWYDYTSTDFHTDAQYDKSTNSASIEGGAGWGLWKVGGSFKTENSKTDLNVQTDNLEVKMKYAIVDVDYVGIDTSVLSLKNWF
ncbi:hypothetical protein AB0M20_00525, partial [Actinoplanes sp. NPDC051633]|uniref:hypothetical protein n=1 Tax=Actinoplanes sp. NPDC051633 TaxID=3155670 RepID=UPI003431CE7A